MVKHFRILVAVSAIVCCVSAANAATEELRLDSPHPYSDNMDEQWEVRSSTGALITAVHFKFIDVEKGYDTLTVLDAQSNAIEVITGNYEDYTVETRSPVVFIRLESDYSVHREGFSIDQISTLQTSCEEAGGRCVFPKGGCSAPSRIDESLACAEPNKVCCMPEEHDPRCDDGTEPICDMVPPICGENEIFAYQDNCYRCVDPQTCEPVAKKAEIGEPCDGPGDIECVEGAHCAEYRRDGDELWGTCHGDECNGPEGVECPTGKHCQLYYRFPESWGWCAQGSEEGGMCGGFAGFRCIDDPHMVCDYQPGLVCQDNAADIAGTCTFVPDVCEDVDEPVCGCDGRTYENDCMRLKQNMGKAHDGPCCFATGCSGEICSSTPVYTTCQMKPEYACYRDEDVATCGVDENGSCAWLDVTPGSLEQCLDGYNDNTGGLGEACGGFAGILCDSGLVCALAGDYPDAGGVCEEAGTWHTREVALETPHPYDNKMSESYTVSVPGAEQVRVHFEYFNVEDGYDWAWIEEDPSDYWTGEKDPFWSPAIEGDSLTIRFYSDYLVTGYGFAVDRVEYFM